MGKNIEQTFFNEFLDNGAAWRCLEYLILKYEYSNLDKYPEYLKKEYITDALPTIKNLTDAYDDTPLFVSVDNQPPLMWTEIEENIENCNNDAQKKRYLYSLLLPFKEWAAVFFPKHDINCLQKEIEQCEHDIPLHKKHVANLKDGWDKDEALGEIEACKESIEKCKEQIQQLESRRDYYLDIFRNAEENSIEWYCATWWKALNIYTNMLDALLLEFGIDLLALQDEFGIWLKYNRDIISIYGYIGTLEWTQQLIDNLPTQQTKIIDKDINASHFSINKPYDEMQRILAALQQQGFVSTDTTIDTFYYRMTGKGASTTDQIEWIKKGKRNDTTISKRSLVYFIEEFAGYRVSKARDCTNKINDVFGLTLSSSTINRTSNCEYKNEIDAIISSRQ